MSWLKLAVNRIDDAVALNAVLYRSCGVLGDVKHYQSKHSRELVIFPIAVTLCSAVHRLVRPQKDIRIEGFFNFFHPGKIKLRSSHAKAENMQQRLR